MFNALNMSTIKCRIIRDKTTLAMINPVPIMSEGSFLLMLIKDNPEKSNAKDPERGQIISTRSFLKKTNSLRTQRLDFPKKIRTVSDTPSLRLKIRRRIQ